MDIDNVIYLENIAERVTYYNEARKKGANFIVDNKIVNKSLIVNILLMTAVWAAYQRQEVLTDDEVLIFFGLQAQEREEEFHTFLEIHPKHRELTLYELLEMTVENFR